jgi:hypothetical protein
MVGEAGRAKIPARKNPLEYSPLDWRIPKKFRHFARLLDATQKRILCHRYESEFSHSLEGRPSAPFS